MHSLPTGPLDGVEIPAFPLSLWAAAAASGRWRSLRWWEAPCGIWLQQLPLHRDPMAGRHDSGPWWYEIGLRGGAPDVERLWDPQAAQRLGRPWAGKLGPAR